MQASSTGASRANPRGASQGSWGTHWWAETVAHSLRGRFAPELPAAQVETVLDNVLFERARVQAGYVSVGVVLAAEARLRRLYRARQWRGR